MISLPIGFIATFIVFYVSMGAESLPLYFNLHSAVLVGGGTITILFFATPWNVLSHLGREMAHLFHRQPTFEEQRETLISFAKNRTAPVSTKDPLLIYAQELWTQGVSHDVFVVLVSQKRKEIEQKSVDSIQCLKNLAKYPPALGMAGTVMGIVTLFQSLEGGKDKIGPALAVALTATFFGLVIANGLVMPLSDRLQVRHLSQSQYLDHLYQVLLLINEGEAAQLIEDEVKLRAS